jgi:phosphoserine phosphatase RsbU/P
MPDYSILVVEDEPTLRRLLEYRLSKQYRVRTASNGEEALALVEAERPQLIVSDVMMPRLDGFALLNALQENPATRVIPFIFLTAKADEQSRLRGLRSGVDDYITKPFDFEQLMERIARLLERAHVYQSQFSSRVGEDFSRLLMPRAMPEIPGYSAFFFNLPREQGGGDFFDWVEPMPGTYFFTLGDVMGKGVRAKFFAFSFLSYVRGTLHALLGATTSPATIMAQLNRLLSDDAVLQDTFASLLLLRLDAHAHRVTLCNAGHCRPVLAAPGGADVVTESDLVLGLTPDSTYSETVVEMTPGMQLFSYTDGLLEQRLRGGDMVGEHGLIAAMQQVQASPDPLIALTDDLLAASEAPEFADDILGFWLRRH